VHGRRTIATDVPVACCVCLSVSCLLPAKTAERIDVLFSGGDSWRTKKRCISWESQSPYGEGESGNVIYCTVNTAVPTHAHSMRPLLHYCLATCCSLEFIIHIVCSSRG